MERHEVIQREPRGVRATRCLGTAMLAWVAACGARDGLDVDPVDAAVEDHAIPPGCDGASAHVWLLSEDSRLYQFDPERLSVKATGTLRCAASPNSMAISRSNVGYMAEWWNGELFTFDLSTGQCDPTPFSYGSNYGMGFVATDDPAREALYITSGFSLGTVDVHGSFEYTEVTRFNPPLPAMELAGTGDGRLYGVHVADPPSNGELLRFDKLTGAVVERVELPMDRAYRAIAFAIWAGSFYAFSTYENETHTRIIRYTPGRGAPKQVKTIDAIIVGAGSSTCAPL